MAKNEKNVEKKSGFFSKVNNFFRTLGERIKGLKSEWKKVSWASPRATFKNFALVLVVVICFAVALGIIGVLAGMGVTGLNTLFNNWFPQLFTL